MVSGTGANQFEDVIISIRAQRDAAENLTRATRQLNSSMAQAARELQTRLAGFLNPVKRLEDSLMRLDKTNQAALAIGTTTKKLSDSVNKNSQILKENNTSQQKLLDAIVTNFESGVRVQNGAISKLTQEMIATGQDVRGLTTMNSDLLLFTGDNVKALQDANKANKEISDKYGVSNQKLIESVNSLKQTFEEASFFGADTTESLVSLTKELKARTGGKNVEGAIRTLFSLGTGGLDTLSTSLRVGGGGFRGRASAGQAISMSDLMPILNEVARIAGESSGGSLGIGADIAAMRTGLSRQQVIELVNLRKQLDKDYRLNEEQKKTNDETYNSLENINARARNFYDKTAVQSLAALGGIGLAVGNIALNMAVLGGFAKGLNIARGGSSFRGAAGVGGYLANFMAGRAGRFVGRGLIGGTGFLAGEAGAQYATREDGTKNVVGTIFSRMLQGASIGAITANPFAIAGGAIVGGVMGVMQSIEANTGKSAKAEEEQAEIAKRKEREDRAMAAAKELERVSVLTSYIRSRTDLSYGPEIAEVLNKQYQLAQAQARNANRGKLGSSEARK